ncbi:hypothetical protein SERP0584 [Staphylococcus epidermidis RP62A]|uniref:Uncharacterized protein n=1 Tax=Staphylococcus epidermidis (strain ATCC 35984 / DSM 28319 / BCRC 17069 / CCUG 31568 / BM 3577 / RP62A) TaxID=176279 RepID=Q5HQG5_STAEQ|nr:hypothetical protein SERP0584 [Staphylococcus epidermidis RP62A]
MITTIFLSSNSPSQFKFQLLLIVFDFNYKSKFVIIRHAKFTIAKT